MQQICGICRNVGDGGKGLNESFHLCRSEVLITTEMTTKQTLEKKPKVKNSRFARIEIWKVYGSFEL